jgi:hypothetical protein
MFQSRRDIFNEDNSSDIPPGKKVIRVTKDKFNESKDINIGSKKNDTQRKEK